MCCLWCLVRNLCFNKNVEVSKGNKKINLLSVKNFPFALWMKQILSSSLWRVPCPNKKLRKGIHNWQFYQMFTLPDNKLRISFLQLTDEVFIPQVVIYWGLSVKWLNVRVCLCVLSRFHHVQLRDPMDCSPPGFSVHGILQARILEWVATPSSRESSRPRDWTQISRIAGGFLTVWAAKEAPHPLGSPMSYFYGYFCVFLFHIAYF